MSMQINIDRLKKDITELSEIGKASDRGLYRMAFSDSDMDARNWLINRIKESGLSFSQDGAGNIYAKLNPDDDKPSIMTGSHIDTVPSGGHLDGALGVLSGLECLRTLKENNVKSEYPIELVSFSDEEGRFGGLFGSQSICGEMTPEKIHNAIDLDGVSITEAMSRQGLDAMQSLEARRTPGSILAYLELHIEQGPALDNLGIPVGLVEHITGLFKWNARIIGKANHAGTTPMSMRQDAFMALAEFAGEIPRIIEERGTENTVATIGKVNLLPGSANVIPGLAEFSIDARDPDPEALRSVGDGFRTTLSAIARRRKLMFEFDVLSEIQPKSCAPRIIEAINRCAGKLGISTHRMFSGSVHDALVMAGFTDMGMIMVPSIGGVSHSPGEWTAWEDIETGANLMLHTLMDLAGC